MRALLVEAKKRSNITLVENADVFKLTKVKNLSLIHIFVCLLSFVLSLLILGAALFGVYSLYTVSGLDKEKYSVPILSLLYALSLIHIFYYNGHLHPYYTREYAGEGKKH